MELDDLINALLKERNTTPTRDAYGFTRVNVVGHSVEFQTLQLARDIRVICRTFTDTTDWVSSFCLREPVQSMMYRLFGEDWCDTGEWAALCTWAHLQDEI